MQPPKPIEDQVRDWLELKQPQEGVMEGGFSKLSVAEISWCQWALLYLKVFKPPAVRQACNRSTIFL